MKAQCPLSCPSESGLYEGFDQMRARFIERALELFGKSMRFGDANCGNAESARQLCPIRCGVKASHRRRQRLRKSAAGCPAGGGVSGPELHQDVR